MPRFDRPPVEYLRKCSDTSLRYFEMSKLEHAANLRRELTVLLDEMMEETALALLARWMLDKRSTQPANPKYPLESRRHGPRRARELISGWLNAARQIESGTPQSSSGGGRARGAAQTIGAAHPPNASGTENPATCREADDPGAEGPRGQRRMERKSARAARGSLRSAGALHGRAEPEPVGG